MRFVRAHRVSGLGVKRWRVSGVSESALMVGWPCCWRWWESAASSVTVTHWGLSASRYRSSPSTAPSTPCSVVAVASKTRTSGSG
ncbi:hypothetical protein EXE47_11585 [Halorubrum sp. GN12_10-3_MGM]|nr:hypothetical protein EXE47_11585 [Halorubrum sp. GN12_10-3_MGM]